MRLILLAPPGGGKGTQCALINSEYKILQVSTGELLREHKKRRTKIGRQARFYMDAGELVPDRLINGMLADELVKDKYKDGFILDGFPRTIQQAIELNNITTALSIKIDAIIILEVPKDELISRLSSRRVCEVCGKVYHLVYNPPADFEYCDKPCYGKLFQRDDDRPDTIINRLKIYDSKTVELIEYYLNNGKAHFINGVGEVNIVFKRIRNVLDAFLN